MRRYLILIMVTLLLVPVGSRDALAFGSDSEPPAPSLVQVKRHLKKGRYAEALEILNKLAETDPDNPDVFNYLGFASRKLGRYPEAHTHYGRALALDPMHRGANEYLGELHLLENNPDLAEARLEALRAACPTGCEERGDLERDIRTYRRKHRE